MGRAGRERGTGVVGGAALVTRAPASAGVAGGIRRDIQGLRAVAVLLVMAFHAGVPGFGGGYVGVDVFFVISGFLITGLIVREMERTGRLSLRRFYARRIRRLLPATAVTFVGVAALTLVALPPTRWASIAGDIVASAAYVLNWRLAARSVDYLQAESAASPLQHFWSLAVEEQFYIVWPVLIVALAWFAVRRGQRATGAGSPLSTGRLMLGLAAIGVPSLAWSAYLTGKDPGPAYFVTTTRLWELVVGALLAVGVVRAGRAPLPLRAAGGWLGLGAIMASAMFFTARTPFPGVAALVPTLGSAAVLWAGTGDGRGRLRLLEPGPMQDVGALSYSLYLWHWPLLVVATAVWGREDGTLWLPTALMVAGFSAVPAWLTYRVVEQPLHHHPALAVPWRAAVAGAVCVAIGLGAALTVSRSIPRAEALVFGADEPLGARALGDDPTQSPAGIPVDHVDSITPSPLDAPEDVATLDGERCIAPLGSVDPVSCTYGDPASDTVVAVVGDSKMHQYLPALQELADARGWLLKTNLGSACPFMDGYPVAEGVLNDACREINRQRISEIAQDSTIDVVLVSQVATEACTSETCEEQTTQAMREASRSALGRLVSAGQKVIVVVNNQHPGLNVMDCVAEHEDELTACAFDRKTGDVSTLELVAEDLDLPVVDVRPWICPGLRCPAVIGGVLVYRQGSHLTATYVHTLAGVLGEHLADAGLD